MMIHLFLTYHIVNKLLVYRQLAPWGHNRSPGAIASQNMAEQM